MGDYVAINKAMWDERAPAHAASAHYGFDRFIGDPPDPGGRIEAADATIWSQGTAPLAEAR